jgi:hypothetical protein
MELDELKQIWSQYDKKLTENLRLNEELFKKLNIDKSKREMNTPLNYEIFSIIGSAIFLTYILSSTFRFLDEIKFLVPGLITSLILILGLVFSIHRIKLFSSIDYYNTSVVELQKKLAQIKQIYLKYKKIELYSSPFLFISGILIVGKSLRNFDLYEHQFRYITAVVIVLAIMYPILIWIYKNMYEKKLKNSNDFLQELIRFEKEE